MRLHLTDFKEEKEVIQGEQERETETIMKFMVSEETPLAECLVVVVVDHYSERVSNRCNR